ncbi:F-box domain [Thalictrum thalictroides]|uniref:F-box domain n=1 Tax=Thalictrum thalictroides TaxID=46969 RepID=A0A7J6VJJ7_THATH|nr:F-box domain [Thalictrum thalictroides]
MMTTAASKQRIKIDLRFASPDRHCMSFLYGSHNGFLLFKNIHCDTVLFIWNPITHEKLILDTDSLCHAPCAFYFHPKSREHRVLLRFYNKATRLFEFIVVSLETKLSRAITTSFSHPPFLEKNPIILNGALHWPVDGVQYETLNGIQLPCSNSIIAFDMDREEVLQTISHPGNQCAPSADYLHINMQIIDMEGKLCYCDCNPSYYSCTEIRLWILEDYEKQVWVKRHVVNTDSIMNSIGEKYRASERPMFKNYIELVHMYGDELLINLFSKFLFLCNLQSGTFRRAGEKRIGVSTRIRPVAHINTLVSLKKMDGRHA